MGGGGGGYSGLQVMIERFFWGLKFSILGFFWVGRFGKYFFCLDLSRDLSRDFLVIQSNLKIRGSAGESTTKLVLWLF